MIRCETPQILHFEVLPDRSNDKAKWGHLQLHHREVLPKDQGIYYSQNTQVTFWILFHDLSDKIANSI